MTSQNARSRFFAVKATIAKKAANDNEVVFCGHRIAVSEDNAQLVEFIREADAQAAYEAAAMGREPRAPRIAA